MQIIKNCGISASNVVWGGCRMEATAVCPPQQAKQPTQEAFVPIICISCQSSAAKSEGALITTAIGVLGGCHPSSRTSKRPKSLCTWHQYR